MRAFSLLLFRPNRSEHEKELVVYAATADRAEKLAREHLAREWRWDRVEIAGGSEIKVDEGVIGWVPEM